VIPKTTFAVCSLLLFLSPLLLTADDSEPESIRLYREPPPHPPDMRELTDENLLGNGMTFIRNVTDPSLTVFLPDPERDTGTAVVVAPGGAFMMLSWENEGTTVARALAERGITAFVLKYRIEQTPDDPAILLQRGMERVRQYAQRPPHAVPGEPRPSVFPTQPLAAEDAAQAVKLVRSRAGDWGLDPDKVGFLGFSAGAITATDIATSDDPSDRPDFVGVIYGNLDRPVPRDAPPAFFVTAADDPIQGPAAVIPMFNAWRAAGRPAELHIYEGGDHGFGMKPKGTTSDHWLEQFIWWLQSRGLLDPGQD
jgi:acetyl esterase/lipase